jgi:glucosamine-6-phosphate deaminase
MQENLFKHINIKSENIYLLDGMVDDIESEATLYEEKIRLAGGIDLQILGIGPNGHIGFNEPGNSLNVKTHLVNLSQDTIKANSRFYNSKEKIPDKAITVGMATIFKSKRLLLLASGSNKAHAIKKLLVVMFQQRFPLPYYKHTPV